MIFNKKIVFLIIIVFINIIYAENKIAIMVKSPDLDIYSKAVVENKLISHLSKISNYTVVERRDLPAIITEREFQEFYNDENDYPINSFSAADHILICNIHSIENQFSLNLKIEKIETGEIIASADIFTGQSITELINSLPQIILKLVQKQFSIDDLPAEIDFLSIPIRNTKSFLNHDLIKLNQPNTGGAIESIFIMNNSLLAVSNPLQLTEYHNFINNSPPARIVFKYPHWETTSSAISTTNQLFATTLSDGTICIWDTNEWGAPYQLQYSDKKAEVVTFSQSGLVLFAGFSDGTIEFIDSNTFEIINTDNISDNEIVSIKSINSGLIIIDGYQNIYLYNVKEQNVVATYPGYDTQFFTIELSNDKKILAIGQLNGSIKLYDISNIITSEFIDGDWANPYIRYKWTFTLSGQIKSFDFSNSDDIIAVLMEKNSIEYIDIINKNIYHDTMDSIYNVKNNTLKFVDDYNLLLGSNDGKIIIRTIK